MSTRAPRANDPRCGVYALVAVDAEQPFPYRFGLGDLEHARFAREFEMTMRVLGRFIREAEQHIPFLLRKAQAAEDQDGRRKCPFCRSLEALGSELRVASGLLLSTVARDEELGPVHHWRDRLRALGLDVQVLREDQRRVTAPSDASLVRLWRFREGLPIPQVTTSAPLVQSRHFMALLAPRVRGVDVRKMSGFQWTRKREKAAIAIAQGYTIAEAAEQARVAERTICRWKRHLEFSSEVDRLSLMVDIAGRAERLRIAMRMIRKKGEETDRDLLDWLKYAQSETDGVRPGLTARFEAAISLADSGRGTGCAQG